MFGEHESDFHRLFVIQPRVDGAAIVTCEVGFGEIAWSAGAFRDIFAGEFEMNTGESSADLAVDAEGRDDFRDDIIEGARFDAIAGSLGVAVHGIAAPEDSQVCFLNGFGEPWEFGSDFVGPEAVNESQSSGFVGGIQDRDEFDKFGGGDGIADFEPDGIANAAAVFDVGTVQSTGAIADPEHVSAEVVGASIAFGAGECLFVVQEQGFVGGEEVDACELREFAGRDDFHEANGVTEGIEKFLVAT